MNFKSVIFGWLNAFLVIFGLMCLVHGGFLISDQNKAPNNGFDGVFKMVLGLMCLFVWLLFFIRPFQAGQERTDELLALIGSGSNTHNDDVH